MMAVWQGGGHAPAVAAAVVVAVLGFGTVGLAAEAERGLRPAIIPQPVSMDVRAGQFRFTPATRLVAEGPAAGEAEKLAEALAPAMGCRLERAAAAGPNTVMLALEESLARKERDYAPVLPPGEHPAPARVLWFDDESSGGTVLELRATDRIGMLHSVAAALERCGADVLWARVATLGVSVVDSFGLACAEPDDVASAEKRREIERAVLAAAG